MDQTHLNSTMPMTRQEVLDDANKAQQEASDPMASVFVSASAGSGKTKLLIDRLLRLMLPIVVKDKDGNARYDDDGALLLEEGSEPSRILCLTYTKAAAAEMAHRLQSHLGRWVSLSDAALGAALEALEVPNTPHTRERARGLFLKVLDAPGGLQIETIHAFCQSLLRRFPLEAELDPHFSLIEDRDSRMALRRALDDGLATAKDPVKLLAGLIDFNQLMTLLNKFKEQSGRLEALMQLWQTWPEQVELAYKLLLDVGSDGVAQLKHKACILEDEAGWRADIEAAFPRIAKTKVWFYQALLDFLNMPADKRDVYVLQAFFFKATPSDGPKLLNYLVSQDMSKLAPELKERVGREMDRQVEMWDRIRTQELLEANMAFLALALPVLVRFGEEKKNRGVVDYSDLIARTRDVLQEPGAAWVLYKLDGGIDHLLLDEVQDTSALQWEIAGALTADFFSGAATREGQVRPRTIFAVGDFKQSIYGFQGADPEQFYKWRRIFAQRVEQAGLLWRDPKLNVSFRSVPPILEMVDAVFTDDEHVNGPQAIDGLREEGDITALKHRSARSEAGGRVELWPLVSADAATESSDGDGEEVADPWRAPQRNEDQRSALQRLADVLAAYIDDQIGQPLQPGTAPLKAGDILVLVPQRSPFLTGFIRALKARDVPVASFIRAGLTEQAAVQDLMTLCEALLLPQDDLSLASVLTSPLGGLSDESLMDLATENGHKCALGRQGAPLWSVLRARHQQRPEWSAAWERLQALYKRVDYDTPYNILMQALGEQGGRARLLTRLGPEAAEPVDELLTAALGYEAQHPPSLQGFLQWLRASAVDSRREAESDIRAVRIMTVHGSKGLQARFVIMPDTMRVLSKGEKLLWQGVAGAEDGMGEQGQLACPLWIPRANMATECTKRFAEQEYERLRKEKNRLLYVALTRASDALLICGWDTTKPKASKKEEKEKEKEEEAKNTWYNYCREGLLRLPDVKELPFTGEWGGERLLYETKGTRDDTSKKDEDAVPVEAASLPDWMGQAPEWRVEPAPHEDALARPLAPSRPENAIFGAFPAARSPLEIMKEGLIVPQPADRRQDAVERGIVVHRLLQILPDIPPQDRLAKAEGWLRHSMSGLGEEDVRSLAQHVCSVLAMDVLAPVFGPGSRAEQGISGTLGTAGDGTGRVVLGQVDRFCFDGTTVWLCDYKTGRPPAQARSVSAAYVAQMASYRQVMQTLYQGHEVRCFIVWVDGPKVTELPTALLDEHNLP